MENLYAIIPDFLKGVNLVYIIGIISPIFGALWAYRKFLYEKQLERFNEANTKLFNPEKQEVLAAIATLGVFNRNRKFKQNTIDVLLSRLYTELDYDVTNAIASALIQYSNRKELKYIADELAGINRNFYFQTYPTQQMMDDLKRNWSDLKFAEYTQSLADVKPEPEKENSETDQLPAAETPEAEKGNLETAQPTIKETEIETDNLDEIKQKLLKEHLRIYPKILYELSWHKQVTGDTYARIMRKASRESKLTGRQKKLEMRLFQNDFNYTHLAGITTSKCRIENCALGSAILSDIVFSNIKVIKDSTFSESNFRNCTFENGKIMGNSFIRCTFSNVVFERIIFEESFFWRADFFNCKFIDCKNATPELFFEAKFDKRTKLPFSRKSLSALKNTHASDALDGCTAILDMRRDEVRSWLDYWFPKTVEPPAAVEAQENETK